MIEFIMYAIGWGLVAIGVYGLWISELIVSEERATKYDQQDQGNTYD